MTDENCSKLVITVNSNYISVKIKNHSKNTCCLFFIQLAFLHGYAHTCFIMNQSAHFSIHVGGLALFIHFNIHMIFS